VNRTAAVLFSLLIGATAGGQSPPPFRVEEATIADIHAALKSGRATCRAVVEQYLRRIEAYDKNGPALNAIVVINPEAPKIAEELDRKAAQGGFAGPLHCVPTIVKDNFETIGLQSANGSLALAGFVSHVSPGTYSIARNGWPRCSPTSKMVTMLGWRSRPADRASRVNRSSVV